MQLINLHELKETSCTCNICKHFCNHSPGWFLSSQIMEIEQFFGKPWKELLGRELAINYFFGDNENILVLAPNISNNREIVYPFDPRGRCVFFQEEECAIYAIRPFECKISTHDSDFDSETLHRAIATQWLSSATLNEFKIKIPQATFEDFFNFLYGDLSQYF